MAPHLLLCCIYYLEKYKCHCLSLNLSLSLLLFILLLQYQPLVQSAVVGTDSHPPHSAPHHVLGRCDSHRIIESYNGLGWKGPCRSSSSSHPAMGRDTFYQNRLLKAPSSLALNTSREGTSTASLGNLCQCLTTLIVKNFFFISHLNLPFFSLKPLPLVLSLHALVKKSLSSFPVGPLRVLEGCYKICQQPSLLLAEQPQLSQSFLTAEVFHPSDHFCGLLWTCSNRSVSFLC